MVVTKVQMPLNASKPVQFKGHYLIQGTSAAVNTHLDKLLELDIPYDVAHLHATPNDEQSYPKSSYLVVTGDDVVEFQQKAPPQTIRPNPQDVENAFRTRIRTLLDTKELGDFFIIMDAITGKMKTDFIQANKVIHNPDWPPFLQRITQPHSQHILDAETLNEQLNQRQFDPLQTRTGMTLD